MTAAETMALEAARTTTLAAMKACQGALQMIEACILASDHAEAEHDDSTFDDSTFDDLPTTGASKPHGPQKSVRRRA